MISERQFYVTYADYDVIITTMNEKLLKAQKNNPTMDFSKQLDTIKTLRGLQVAYHQMYHECLTIDNHSGKIMFERDNLMKKIAQLEKENKELKENISL
jgi:hypothetical protein